MDDKLVAGFLKAIREVFHEIGLTIDRICSVTDWDVGANMIATVGILGDVRGSILLRLDRQSARNIVAAMLQSMGMEAKRGLALDAEEAGVAEIANQICGRAITILSGVSLECDITPPAVISGSDITSSLPGAATLEYRSVEGPFGKLLVFLGIKD